jgi:hypothetical protein
MDNIQNMGMHQEASLVSNKDEYVGIGVVDYFEVTCYDINGDFKWKETIKNLVTTQGLNYIMEAGFRSGTTYANWYVGLKDTGSPAAGDAASALPSVGAWTEYTEYTSSVRPTLTLDGAFASGTQDNSASPASFSIDTPAPDVYGVFLVDSNSKGANTGANVLYGVGDFGAAKVVDAGDTLNVTVTLQASSA